MRRDVGAALLFVAGAAVLEVTLSDGYLDYVRAGHRWWLLATGVVLVVAGAVGLVSWARNRADDVPAPAPRVRVHTHGPLAAPPEEIARVRAEEREARREHGHDHRRRPAAGWLLVLPVLLVLVVPPPALGAWAAARQGARVPMPAASARHPGPLPGDPAVPVDVTVGDYARRAVWDGGRTLAGREVVLTGFVTAAPDGGWYVGRAVISCCAADARTSLVHVDGEPGRTSPPTDTWVRVTGRFLPATSPDPATATARVGADAVTTVAAPADPYEQ